MCSGDIEHNITFWSKLSVVLSAVTLEIRSRSQSPNQGFCMSMCCIHANFGQNPVIRSGCIVHILMIHTKVQTLIKKLEKMSFHAVIPLSLGSNLPCVYKNDNPNF